jgi:hypothetical protein
VPGTGKGLFHSHAEERGSGKGLFHS